MYFRLQSTRPVWGATCQTHSDFVEPGISIHAPAWGATVEAGRCKLELTFQSTRPRGARPRTPWIRIMAIYFNPRARVGRDQTQKKHILHKAQFQSTRPRRARRFTPSTFSIASVFQSTRPRGARRHPCARLVHPQYFNPRARVGRDVSRE